MNSSRGHFSDYIVTTDVADSQGGSVVDPVESPKQWKNPFRGREGYGRNGHYAGGDGDESETSIDLDLYYLSCR